MSSKETVFLYKWRSDQIAGLRKTCEWLELQSDIVERNERPLVHWLRDSGIKFDDALRVLKAHYEEAK